MIRQNRTRLSRPDQAPAICAPLLYRRNDQCSPQLPVFRVCVLRRGIGPMQLHLRMVRHTKQANIHKRGLNPLSQHRTEDNTRLKPCVHCWLCKGTVGTSKAKVVLIILQNELIIFHYNVIRNSLSPEHIWSPTALQRVSWGYIRLHNRCAVGGSTSSYAKHPPEIKEHTPAR
jgi:hypothetical protein